MCDAPFLESFRCAYDADAGRLYLMLPWHDRRIRYLSWEEGCLVQEEHFGEWQPIDDEFDLPVASGLASPEDASHPVERYRRTIPKDIIGELAMFLHGQTGMLQLCAASRRARWLLHNHRMVLWLAAPVLLEMMFEDRQKFRELMEKEPAEILEATLGIRFPEAVWTLDWISTTSRGDNPRQVLTTLFQQPRILRFLARKPPAFFRWEMFYALFRGLKKANLPNIMEVLREDPGELNISTFTRVERVINSIYDLNRVLKDDEIPRQIKNCRTELELNKFYDSCLLRFAEERKKMLDLQKGSILPLPCFPLPPLAGNENIIPICSDEELRLEANFTQSGVYEKYAPKIRKGESYAYSALKPERGIAIVNRRQKWRWELSRFFPWHNAPVSSDTMDCLVKSMRGDEWWQRLKEIFPAAE